MIDNFLTWNYRSFAKRWRNKTLAYVGKESFNELIDSLTKARGNYLNSSFRYLKIPWFGSKFKVNINLPRKQLKKI